MDLATRNRRLMKKLLLLTLAMFGFGFAMIPFYKTLCEVAGINQLIKARFELLLLDAVQIALDHEAIPSGKIPPQLRFISHDQ